MTVDLNKTYVLHMHNLGYDLRSLVRFDREMASMAASVAELAADDDASGGITTAVGKFALYVMYSGLHAILQDEEKPIPKALLDMKNKALERAKAGSRELKKMGIEDALLNKHSDPYYLDDHRDYMRTFMRSVKNNIDVPEVERKLLTLAWRLHRENVADSAIRSAERMLWQINPDLGMQVANFLHAGDTDKVHQDQNNNAYAALRALVKKMGGSGLTLPGDLAEKARSNTKMSSTYKEYLVLRRQLKKAFDTAFLLMIAGNGNKPMPVEAAEAQMRKKGFELMFMPTKSMGFNGKVGLSGGKMALFTNSGRSLVVGNVAPGSKITMNPKYDEETDNAYVMLVTVPGAITEGSRIYTSEYRKKAVKSKFSKADVLTTNIPKLVATWKRDMQSKDPMVSMHAVAAMIQYLTGARVGARLFKAASKKGGQTYGIISLRPRHIKITPSAIIFDYVGKKNGRQRHVLKTNNQVVKYIAKYLKTHLLTPDKGKDDLVFSRKGITGERMVNITSATYNRYLRSIGFSEGSHKLRHVRGTALVREILGRSNWKPSKAATTLAKRQKEADDYMKSKVLTKVAELLGHRSTAGGKDKLLWRTSMQAYINPNIVRQWYEENRLDVPKWVPSRISNDD